MGRATAAAAKTTKARIWQHRRPRGRPPRLGVERPPCPVGHEGRILLDGHYTSRYAPVERSRYRCVPADGSGVHVFRPPLRTRHTITAGGVHQECDACERGLARNDGVRIGDAYEFAIREIAHCFVRLGHGGTYRGVSAELRTAVGKTIRRGQWKGKDLKSVEGSLAINYLDAFGEIVIGATRAAAWPAIISVDALPLRARMRTTQRLHKTTAWPASSRPRRHPRKRRKILRSARVHERGRILVASGKDAIHETPRPILIRFMGGGDEESWLEFLRSLPGAPAWVVSDRDGAIENAVKRAWPGQNVTHYLSEVHIAKNVGEAAVKDHIPARDPIWELLEDLQDDPAKFYPLAEARARALKAPGLRKWLTDNRLLICAEQPAKRAAFPYHPRSSGAAEATIEILKRLVKDRGHLFGNADRLDRLLALIRNQQAGLASEAAYSQLLRAWFAAQDGGKGKAEWDQIRDPRGTSSIRLLIRDAEARQTKMRAGRQATGKARRYRTRRAIYVAQRQAMGLPPPPRGRRRASRAAQGSVAGTTIADYGWLVAEWHPTLNGTLRPEDVPAGSGRIVIWKCPWADDHFWPAQARSRSIRGSGCPFCDGKQVAPSDSIATTHPDIAAQWHPTKNGTHRPQDLTYGSHFEAIWQCPRYKTHVYPARISSRTSMLSGCPGCARLAGKGGRARKGA